MTYEEMMILTEQHLESQVFGPLFLPLELDFNALHTLLSSNIIYQLSVSPKNKKKCSSSQLFIEPFTCFLCLFLIEIEPIVIAVL